MLHQPAEGPLDHPPLGQRLEALLFRSLYHLHVDPEAGAVLDDAGLVAAVGPHLGHARMGRRQLGQGLLAAGGVVDRGGGDQDGQDQSEGVGDQVTLAPLIFLPASIP